MQQTDEDDGYEYIDSVDQVNHHINISVNRKQSINVNLASY